MLSSLPYHLSHGFFNERIGCRISMCLNSSLPEGSRSFMLFHMTLMMQASKKQSVIRPVSPLSTSEHSNTLLEIINVIPKKIRELAELLHMKMI